MNIYDINAEINEILNCLDVDEETGELKGNQELIDRLSSLEVEAEVKALSVAKYIKNLNAEALALKAEEKSLEKRRKVKENKIKSLKRYIEDNFSGASFEDAQAKISWRKSVTCEILNAELLDKRFFVEQEPKISIQVIKKELKNGVTVSGACLVEKNNLQVK